MFQVVSGFRESSLAKKRGYFLYSLIGATCFFACFPKDLQDLYVTSKIQVIGIYKCTHWVYVWKG